MLERTKERRKEIKLVRNKEKVMKEIVVEIMKYGRKELCPLLSY
jgi:hypothetical protein